VAPLTPAGPTRLIAGPSNTQNAGDHVASLRRVARGGFYSLAGSLVTAVAAFGFTAIVTRSLTDQGDAGTLFALTSAFMVATAVIRLGAPTGLVYFLNRYRKTGQQHRIRLVWRAAYVPVVVLAVGLGAAGIVAAPVISSFLVGRDDAATVLLTKALSAILVFAAVGDLAQGSTRGYGAMRPLVLIARVGRPALQVMLAAAVVVSGAADLVSLGLAWAVPFVPSAIALYWWARRLDRMLRPVANGEARRRVVPSRAQSDNEVPRVGGGARTRVRTAARGERRLFWRFTGPRTVASIAQVAIQRIDIVLLGVLAGPAAAALYTAATRFLAFGQLGGQALNQAIESKVASLLAIGDAAGVRAVYRGATVWLMLLTWPVYLTFIGWAPDLLAIFGPGYSDAAAVIVVLSLAMLLGTAAGAVDTMLVMAGRGTWTMFNASAALVVNVALNLALIPRFGIMGAAAAWAAAIAVNNVVPLVQLAMSMRLHPFGRVSVIAAALPAVCFGVTPWLASTAAGGASGHIAGTVAGTLLYAAGLWHWRGVLQLAAFTAIRRRE
jgi:O-antigen/teichoic acid export membrane protein